MDFEAGRQNLDAGRVDSVNGDAIPTNKMGTKGNRAYGEEDVACHFKRPVRDENQAMRLASRVATSFASSNWVLRRYPAVHDAG